MKPVHSRHNIPQYKQVTFGWRFITIGPLNRDEVTNMNISIHDLTLHSVEKCNLLNRLNPVHTSYQFYPSSCMKQNRRSTKIEELSRSIWVKKVRTQLIYSTWTFGTYGHHLAQLGHRCVNNILLTGNSLVLSCDRYWILLEEGHKVNITYLYIRQGKTKMCYKRNSGNVTNCTANVSICNRK